MGKAKFLKSAVLPQDYPVGDRPELAMVGRSNAGKSSLLNALCGGSKIAKVSGTPGKTRLVNFFDVGAHYRFVDLPGYGYAARNQEERLMWADMVAEYLKVRPNLIGIVLICDIRREWEEDEQSLVNWAQEKGLKILCVLTKIDKLGANESRKLFARWIQTSGQSAEFFKPVSNLKNLGVQELEDYLFKNWVKAK